MQNISNELIDREELQRLQKGFCKATGISVCCLDEDGKMLTEISGTAEQVERVRECMKQSLVTQVIERIAEDFLEDQAVEEISPEGDKMAVIAVREKGSTLIYWVAFLFVSTQLDEARYFLNVIDLLRDASGTLFRNKMTSFSAEVESRRSRSAEEEMSRSLRTIETSAKIVQLLDSDDRKEELLRKWLGILSEYLRVDTAQIYQINKEGGTMSVICEWLAPGQLSLYDKTGNLKTTRILESGKPIVISSDTADADQRTYLRELKVEALLQLPVVIGGDGGAMMLELDCRRRHIWTIQEIEFAGNAVRVLKNILTRRMQKNFLASSHQALEAVMDNVGCAVYVTEWETGKVLFANRQLQSIFEKELREGSFEGMLEQGIAQGQESGFFEICHAHRDRWYDLIYKEITWVNGEKANLYSLYDITDKKLYQRRIEQQAYTDFLTGLYNRMCCERDLARKVDEAKKNGSKGALLYLDLDDFKHINDTLGHQYGDVLLKSVSRELQHVSGIENTCYRMGGDEFVIVIPAEKYNEYDRIVDDIRGIFSSPWFLKNTDYYCTMSMGCVTFPDMGDSVTDLVKMADIAMYEAKRGGKNRVVNYTENLDAVSGRRLDMEKGMRDAAVDGYDEFEVYFQPVIDMQNGSRCTGAEALIRWNSAKLGFIPPADFIPLAEHLGLINPIGNYVLKEACIRCHKWNESGYPDYRVSVNLSVVQLLQPDVVEIVQQIVAETGINPQNLTLEVTESLAINDMKRMKRILGRIKALGVKIALDDFGTGYSSLNHIREIPFDVIKVDQSFVKDLAEDAYSQAFIKMIAEMAITLGVSICVEGIETGAQYNVLRDMKVKYIQGYYFDRPMKCQDFEEKYVTEKLRQIER